MATQHAIDEAAPRSGSAGDRPRVLVLSSNYPNRAFPTRGLWVSRMVAASRAAADPVVVAPVPFVPPFVPWERVTRWRKVERRARRNGVSVFHPRVPTGPRQVLHGLDALLAYVPVRRLAGELHRASPFDLIHAHFIYPEGVVAARLGRRFGIPVLTTEHSLWSPWLDEHPVVRAQVVRHLSRIDLVTVVSESVERTVRPFVRGRVPVEVLPNVVDEATFRLPASDVGGDPNRLLFVGAVRHVKGLDILVRAIRSVARRHPDVQLDVIGEPFYRAYQEEEEKVRALVRRLGLEGRVRFLGGRSPAKVAEAMAKAAAVVVPSRRESFSAVTIESLATGTPVVATRCGGPEEILDEETGILVPSEDPGALSEAIEAVLSGRRRFDPRHLRNRAVDRFGRRAVASRLSDLYAMVLGTPDGKVDPWSRS